MVKCNMCRGSGWYQANANQRTKCPYCQGRGSIDEKDPAQQRRARELDDFYTGMKTFGDPTTTFPGGYNPSEVERILNEKAIESKATMRKPAPSPAMPIPGPSPIDVALSEARRRKQELYGTRPEPTISPTTPVAPESSVKRPKKEVGSGHTTAQAKTRSNDNMSEEDIRGQRRVQDMILAPNEFAYISDETKGEVNVFVGPNKQSLAGTDQLVKFDLKSKRFQSVTREQGIQLFQTAPEGWYIVLKNPADGDKHPTGQGKLSTPNLRVGKKVNIPGPASFPLWPGQMAKVVQGHSLKSNEYLLCRVYDEEAAKANYGKAVVKTQGETSATPAAEGESAKRPHRSVEASGRASSDIPTANDLTMGKLFVVRGTEVSFYIPPTGIEVVAEKVNGEERMVREACSLERLEYCLLLDQNGNKRYVIGPDVVFPRPTEKFVEAPIKSNPDKVKAKKFRAQELTPTSGIHIRVIADYKEADGTQRKAGDELFITGNEQPVYFPREEHAIIKYGEQDVHYGIAIPPGEARYILNRLTGEASLVVGPKIFLPDPRTQVILQRALPLDLCSLLYPGNNEALEVNAARLGVEDVDFMGAGGANAAFLNSNYVRSETENEAYGAVAAAATPDVGRGRILIKAASKALPGDAFDRKAKFTAPRSVILNTKYDGAVAVTLWTGFAMLLVRKSGERRVIQGPGTFMLEYDESPQVLSLSTGKPKSTDNILRTVYLQVANNMVSDVVEVETKDFCRIKVKVSYRVNFEGDSDSWFNVDNYVKFLCDAMRSRIRSAVQKLGVEEFYSNHTPILRDIILGAKHKDQERLGTTFAENGMRIYDAEVLGIEMTNTDVEKMLVAAQRSVIQNTLVLAEERRKLEFVKETEELKRQTELARAETTRATLELQQVNAKRKLELDLTLIANNAKQQADQLAAEAAAEAARAANNMAREQAAAEVAALELQTTEAQRAAEREHLAKTQAIELEKLRAQVQATVDKAKSIEPQFVAALQAFGDKALVEKLSEAMAPLAIIGGGKKGVAEIFNDLLKGTVLGNTLGTLAAGAEKSNGAAKTARA
jgi:major vault protein